MVAEPLRFAAECQPLAIPKTPRDEGLVEPGAFKTVFAVVADNDADEAAAIRQLPAGDLHNLTVNSLNLAPDQAGDGPNVRQVFVGPGKVVEEVADRLQTEFVELIEARRSDATPAVKRLLEGIAGPGCLLEIGHGAS